nr:UDP-N-acetylmuramate--L-alanine ligase [Deferribacter autotrophicus]
MHKLFGKVRKVHFIGIGGIGMSGIAEVLHNLGLEVTGSDLNDGANVKRLRELGIKVFIGHTKENIKDADVVVYSSAVRDDNPEILAAKDMHLPVIKRGEMLAELTRLKRSITVSGSHGKTTTTSMIAHIFMEAGFDPTVVVGGRLNKTNKNAMLGTGNYLICESDESDKSFLLLYPTVNVVTNIDLEHLDTYKDLDEIKEAFVEYCNKVPFYGLNVLCIEDKNVVDIIPRIEKRFQTYGFKGSADIRGYNVEKIGFGTKFDVSVLGNRAGEISLHIPGLHNVLNALAAVAVAVEFEIDFAVIKKALESFEGVQRRLSIRYCDEKRTVIDDYGHHPTEIRATLKSIKDAFPEHKLYTIFQPHRYSRTKLLFDEFSSAFFDTDVLIVTDIYPASEMPIEGVDSKKLVENIKEHGLKEVYQINDINEIIKVIEDKNDFPQIILTLGAGNITEYSYKIANYFRGAADE